jgi:hypothetical protein
MGFSGENLSDFQGCTFKPVAAPRADFMQKFRDAAGPGQEAFANGDANNATSGCQKVQEALCAMLPERSLSPRN